MIERRRVIRTKVAQPAKILSRDADILHRCIVTNLSTAGACIIFEAKPVSELPPKFYLSFDNCRTLWDCRVIWRNSYVGRVGVSWKKQ
ncbi:PilZ domain-containing protein [Nitrobacter sp. TKz-YC02]|uniref:PilZ domain-containing protein n=1 Tax=Nitrobacter sp. TKz-YC02 TaxID=3398704 RepID=UPI003CF42A93